MQRCLVRSWKTGLAAMCCAVVLSQNIVISKEIGMHRLCNNCESHFNSEVVADMNLYSAFAEDFATVFCLLVFQETKEEPRDIQ